MPMESNLHTNTKPLETKETHSLIGSDKVDGTAVYRSNGERIGKIQRVMIGKQSGKVGYAVMSFGGFLGIGEEFYPLPWSLLTYNPRLEGYEVNISEAQLKGAPKYNTHENWDWATRTPMIDDYYKSQPNWTITPRPSSTVGAGGGQIQNGSRAFDGGKQQEPAA